MFKDFMGLNQNLSTAQRLSKARGKAPQGRKFISRSVYMPAGESCNVTPTKVRNPLIAANVQMMHEQWLVAFKARPCAL